jgi:hypothetical protein
MLHNDFIAETLLDVMTSQELYFYRQVSKWNYNYITMDKIYNKINQLVNQRLHIYYGTYYELIKTLVKGCCFIEGSLVAECIWGINKDTMIHIVLPPELSEGYVNYIKSVLINIPDHCFKKIMDNITDYDDGPQYMLDNLIRIRFQHYKQYPNMFRYYYNNKKLVLNIHGICHKIMKMTADDNFHHDHNGLQGHNIELTKKLCKTYNITLIDNLPNIYPEIPISEWYFQDYI